MNDIPKPTAANDDIEGADGQLAMLRATMDALRPTTNEAHEATLPSAMDEKISRQAEELVKAMTAFRGDVGEAFENK